MKTYILDWANGNGVSEILARDDKHAITQAKGIILNQMEGAVFADTWDPIGYEGEQKRRLLIWESEEDAENDSGANAIAHLIAN